MLNYTFSWQLPACLNSFLLLPVFSVNLPKPETKSRIKVSIRSVARTFTAEKLSREEQAVCHQRGLVDPMPCQG